MSFYGFELIKRRYLAASWLVLFAFNLTRITIGYQGREDIETYCNNGLDFYRVKDFHAFMEYFEAMSKENMIENQVPQACVKNRDEIMRLSRLVTLKEVCDPAKIDEMIDFHKDYHMNIGILESESITRRFFKRYAVQVAYSCKKSMIRNLEIATAELKAREAVFEEARDMVYNEDPSIRSNIELIREQPDVPVTTNIKPIDDAELTLNEYRDALVNLNRVEDIMTFDRDDCLRSKTRETRIIKSRLQLFFKPALYCHQLHRYYAGSLLSVARLANYGYTALDPALDEQLAANPLIKNWIVAVQVCDPMLYLGSKEIDGEYAIIDTCSPKMNIIETMIYDDPLEHLAEEQLNELVSKSFATRSNARKLMKSALKRMAKVNLMKELRSGASKKKILGKWVSKIATSSSSIDQDLDVRPKNVANRKLLIHTSARLSSVLDPSHKFIETENELSEKESFDMLTTFIDDEGRKSRSESGGEIDDDLDKPVSFDPATSLMTALTVFAIMLSFEWLFFIVMTLAARLCHQLHFNFDNLLTFPPKFLSWSDADFVKFNEKLENMDEDDLYDYDELSPDEREQRDKLAKVFGKPPPMLYKD